MKIVKILYNNLKTVNFHGHEFMISKYWNYMAIDKSGNIMAFRGEPTYHDGYWEPFNGDDVCDIALAEFEGDIKESLMEI